MRIKYKFIISYLILIVLSVSILGFLVSKKVQEAAIKEVNEKNQRLTEMIGTTLNVRNDLLTEKSYSDLNFANTLLDNLIDLRVDYNEIIKVGEFDLPTLYVRNRRLSLDSTVLDELKQSTGTIATIFMLHDDKLIRVSSTIFKDDSRIIGTYISSDSEAYKKIINNQEYVGEVEVLGNDYITRMKPLLDKDKKVIGAIGVGNRILNKYLEDTLSDIKLGKTGYAYILDLKGNIIMHPSKKGDNVKNYNFVQKMYLNKSGSIEYTYNGVKKVAYYQYFEPWNWYIVTTINYDELTSLSKQICTTIMVAGLIIIILGGIASLLIANTLAKPIKKLKSCMEAAGKGDLTVHCNIDSKDEIGVLANSFNNVIEENKKLLEEAVQYDKLKTEFIANISHELRTPLNIIFSTVQLFNMMISNGQDVNTDKAINYTNTMKQNCYRLTRLVNNLIDITKIDSGYMKLNLRNQDIVQVVEEITQSTIEYAESMSREIIFDTDQEEKIMAFDEEKLERILLNLISNAIKFTEPGDKISVTLYDKDDHVIICVRDTGRGIPEDQLEHIFQRFKQVDSLLSRNHEGSGIGLSLVKALVEMHYGTIEVKSKYGEGTEIIICLPVIAISENDED